MYGSFIDTQDRTRTIKPIARNGSGGFICDVFFDGNYAGKTVLPSKMFDDGNPDRLPTRSQAVGFLAQ